MFYRDEDGNENYVDMNYKMTIIVSRHGEWWGAACVEYVLAAQSKTRAGLAHEFMRMLFGTLIFAKKYGVEPALIYDPSWLPEPNDPQKGAFIGQHALHKDEDTR